MFEKMKDMAGLMKKAQAMKSQMKKVQEELKKTSVTARDKKEIIEVIITGELECKEITVLKQDAGRSATVAAIKDAVNKGISQAKALASSKLSAISGGLDIPGLN